MIHLYGHATPNGRKVAIALEEMGLAYEVHPVDFARKEQKSEAFLRLNPNGRIPAIVDDAPPEGGAPATVFESGAILHYLGEVSGRLWPADARARAEARKWLFFASSQVTHTAMQVHWLTRLKDRGEPAPQIEVYRDELGRLYGVLDGVLEGRAFLAGDGITVADIAAWTWVDRHEAHGLDLARWPALARWYETVKARPAVQRGYDVPPRRD